MLLRAIKLNGKLPIKQVRMILTVFVDDSSSSFAMPVGGFEVNVKQ